MAPEGRSFGLLLRFSGCFGYFLFACLRSFLPICDILGGYSHGRDCLRSRESLLKLYIRTLFWRCLSTGFNLSFCPISFPWKSFNSVSKHNWREQDSCCLHSPVLPTLTLILSETNIYNLMSADCTWLSALRQANTIAAPVRNRWATAEQETRPFCCPLCHLWEGWASRGTPPFCAASTLIISIYYSQGRFPTVLNFSVFL